MTGTARPDPSELLQNEAFVRELARRLVFDPRDADDVAQEAWLAALEADGPPPRSLRAWLTTVVRRLARRRARADRRLRDRHERLEAPDPVPTPAELVEREQARAAVVRAVLALPDDYRAVVVLRWFEGLPPREVAAHLSVPVETVRTRHRRAMQRLRERLDDQSDGDRARWCALLLPLATPPRAAVAPAAATAAASTGLLTLVLMSTKLKLAAAAVAVGALSTFAFWPPAAPPPGGPERAGDGGAVAASAGRVAHAPTDPARASTPGGAEPAVVAAGRDDATPAPATTGALELRVAWSGDGAPAADVALAVHGDDANRRLRTDARGVARFAELPAGTYRAVALRPAGRYLEPDALLEVTAGGTLTADMTVPDGLDLRGRVVDGAGAAIPDADIVLGSPGHRTDHVMTRTDEHGAFALRDVGPATSVGARARGYAPSNRKMVQGSVGATVELTIVLDTPAARLQGAVFAPDGRPAAGAMVRVGVPARARSVAGEGYALPPAHQRVEADERGAFAFDRLAPGPQQLFVDCPPFAPHRAQLELRAGAEERRDVHLLQGVTVTGIVRAPGARRSPTSTSPSIPGSRPSSGGRRPAPTAASSCSARRPGTSCSRRGTRAATGARCDARPRRANASNGTRRSAPVRRCAAARSAPTAPPRPA